MPLYTLYPCRADGTSDTFLSFDLMDDGEAQIRALHVLDQHPTAAHVAIWCGERKVGSRYRVHDGLRAVLSRTATP